MAGAQNQRTEDHGCRQRASSFEHSKIARSLAAGTLLLRAVGHDLFYRPVEHFGRVHVSLRIGRDSFRVDPVDLPNDRTIPGAADDHNPVTGRKHRVVWCNRDPGWTSKLGPLSEVLAIL